MKIMEEYADHEDVDFKRSMKTVDSPYLERFYLAEKVCKENNNHSHMKVFNTFMLSSRLLFGCLDEISRVGNMKTPTAARCTKLEKKCHPWSKNKISKLVSIDQIIDPASFSGVFSPEKNYSDMFR